jgi:hypothetical protein
MKRFSIGTEAQEVTRAEIGFYSGNGELLRSVGSEDLEIR